MWQNGAAIGMETIALPLRLIPKVIMMEFTTLYEVADGVILLGNVAFRIDMIL